MKKTILYIKSDDCIKDKLERLFELTDVNNNIEIIVPLLYEDYLKIDKLDARSFIKYSSKKIYIELFTTKNEIIDNIKTIWDQCIFDVYDIVSNKDINSKSYIEIKTLDSHINNNCDSHISDLYTIVPKAGVDKDIKIKTFNSYINNVDQDTKEFIEKFQKIYGKNESHDVNDKQQKHFLYEIPGKSMQEKIEYLLHVHVTDRTEVPIFQEDYNKYVDFNTDKALYRKNIILTTCDTKEGVVEFLEVFKDKYDMFDLYSYNEQNPIESKGVSDSNVEQGPPCKDSLEKVLKKLKPFVKNYIVMVNKVFIPVLKEDYKLLDKYLKLQLKDNVELVLCSNMDEMKTVVSELNHIFGSESKDKIVNIYNNI